MDLEPGAIYLLYFGTINPPKDKFALLACTVPKVRLLFINSVINKFKQSQPKYLQCQVKIPKSEYGFLDHDSYIDCSECVGYDTDQIIDRLEKDPGIKKAVIKERVLLEVRTAINKSKTLTANNKKWMIDGLPVVIV